MPISYTIDSIRFSDGTDVPIEPEGVTVLVGPNNAGKSLALRELQLHIQGNPGGTPFRVVSGISATKSGGDDEFATWIHTVSLPAAEPAARQAKAPGTQVAVDQAIGYWRVPAPLLGQLAPFFVFFLNADNRTNLVGSVNNYDIMNDVPQQALQFLFSDRRLEKELSEASREAFGAPLLVNRYAGSQIHLQLGEMPDPGSVPPDRAYLDSLRQLEYAQAQGDGMKSFIGIMLGVIALKYPVVMIDEPEAFLHPPQARLLGKKLGELCPRGSQVILATHSSEILQGLLEANSSGTRVIRLTRNADVNDAKVISSDDITRFWQHPLLKYSNVLDGLFHRGTVLCESESDATFYAAAVDWWLESTGRPASEYQFTSCGGKQGFPLPIRALRAAGVAVRAIGDFDVLRETEPLQSIVESLGGTFSEIRSNRNQLSTDLANRLLPVTKEAAKTEIDALLEADLSGRITPELSRRIKEIVKVESGWDEAKRSGISGLSGATYTTATSLIADLDQLGLFLVQEGELERLCPEIATLHGSAWVLEALTRDAHQEGAAQEIARRVVESFSS